MGETVIRLHQVFKSFDAKEVLRGLDLEVRRGETVAILGASGCGKSVTLKTINGLIPPDSGQVEVLGLPVTEMTDRQLIPLRRRISYLFQGGALFDSMTVFENVAFPLREHLFLGPMELGERVGGLLSMVDLEGVDGLHPSELSGGMRKRVAVARALALEPEVILYDEPSTGLDPVTSRTIADLIIDLDRRLGVTSVIVTHDIPLVMRVAQRAVFLDGGSIVFSGTLSEAVDSAPEVVREFFSAGGAHA